MSQVHKRKIRQYCWHAKLNNHEVGANHFAVASPIFILLLVYEGIFLDASNGGLVAEYKTEL